MNEENRESFFGNEWQSGAEAQPQSRSIPATHQYVFYTAPNGTEAQRPKNRNTKRVLLTVLTVLLCVTCSFAAGFGGAYLAFRKLNTHSGVNPAPSKDALYQSDPESVLSKSEQENSPYGSAGENAFAISEVVAAVEDTVVVIDATVTTGNPFFGSGSATSAGSGVVISEDGYILTCHHVVNDATSIKVTLNSGTQYEAALVGSDSASDLAVIKIAPTEALTYAKQGNSAELLVGEHVVAIGNPLGTLGGTVTQGIISATERNIRMTDGTVMKLLQTDTAINSGNSGGGLFNLAGELVGIVNAKYAAEGVEGLAFAIPIDSAYEVQLQLIQYGYVRGVIDHGLEVLDVTAENLNAYYIRYQIDTVGVYVISSEHNTDLKNKDRIVAINGTEVKTTEEMENVIKQYAVGASLTVEYERAGKRYTTTLVLQEYVPDYIKDELH